MAAFRMASKGKTMAVVTYSSEKAGIQAFLSMQHDKGDTTPSSPGQVHSKTHTIKHACTLVLSRIS
jgi:hypothetical protein